MILKATCCKIPPGTVSDHHLKEALTEHSELNVRWECIEEMQRVDRSGPGLWLFSENNSSV